MSIAFHRGLTHEMKLRLQLSGIKIDDIDAQRALAGLPIVKGTSLMWVTDLVQEILDPEKKGALMMSWENDHPGQNPFPPSFAEVVIEKLTNLDPSDTGSTISELIELAQGELLFG